MDFDWKAFLEKTWSEGLYQALKKEVVDKTDNTFDDVGLGLVDQAVRGLLSITKK